MLTRAVIFQSNETAWQYINLSWLWHTDSSFRNIPSKGSILHGIETTKEEVILFSLICMKPTKA